MKVGPIDVGQFLLGTIGVILFVALFGLIVLLVVKLAARWMDPPRVGERATNRPRWFQPRFEVQQFSLVSDRQMPLGDLFLYRSHQEAMLAAARYKAVTSHSYFRVLDRKTGEYVQ